MIKYCDIVNLILVGYIHTYVRIQILIYPDNGNGT